MKSSKCVLMMSHYARVSVAISPLSYFNLVAKARALYPVLASEGFETVFSILVLWSGVILCIPVVQCVFSKTTHIHM